MRSPGVIYRQYRLLRHNRLKKEFDKYSKRCPQNCFYWKELSLPDEKGREYKVPICMLGQEEGKPINPKLLAICSTTENAQKCNAFSPKFKKEDIEKKFISDLRDYNTKYEKYPEIAAFEWVLDKSLHEAHIEPNLLSRLIIRFISALEDLLKVVNPTREPLN